MAEPGHPLLAAVRAQPLHGALGLVSLSVDGGTSTVHVRVPELLINAYGKTHAGLLYIFLDLACYVATLTSLATDVTASTVDSSYSFLRSSKLNDLILITGTSTKVGRTLAFGTAEARVGDTLIAQAKITQAIRRY